MAMDMGQEIRAQNAQMKKMAGEAGKPRRFLIVPNVTNQTIVLLSPSQTSVKSASARRTKDRPNFCETDFGCSALRFAVMIELQN